MDDNASITTSSVPQREMNIGRFEYRPDAPIADGGFAFIHWARDRVLETDVALKVLKPDYEENQAAVESFFRDPNIARQLDHPNIIKILSIGDSNRRPYFFAMEYCELGDLRKWIQRERRLPIARALRHAIGICDALQYCHEADVFHRDIKASNILFRNTATPVISDFGNALNEIPLQIEDGRQENVGSPPYMSPEAWEHNSYTAVSDLYSFGVLLYYMITGVLPFSGQTPEEFRKMHLFTVPPLPSKWRASVSKALDEVILTLLEKRPKDRIVTAAEVRSLLQQIYHESYEGVDAASDATVKIFFGADSKQGISPQGFPFRIGKGEPEGLGEQNHLVVGAQDPYVSRCHAIIERFEDGFFFIDVSTNGSWVNGTRLHKKSIELCRENNVLIGKDTSFIVKVSGRDERHDDSTTTFLHQPVRSSDSLWSVQTIVGAGAVLAALGYFLKLILG